MILYQKLVAKIFVIPLLYFAICAASAPTAEAAENLQIGVQDLAKEIVSNADVTAQEAIAVGAFVHRDGTCSDLTDLIYDELVYSLFAEAGEKYRIMERSELPQLFAEQSFSNSGFVDIDTEVVSGKLSGVGAIALGSISNFGDQIRINARLVRADTGRVFSVARSDFPLTDTLRNLTKNRSKSFCKFSSSSGTDAIEVSTPALVTSADSVSVSSHGDFTVELISLSASESGELSRMVFDINNLSDIPIDFAFFNARSEWIYVSDRLGNFIELTQQTGNTFTLRGATVCTPGNNDYSRCNAEYTTIPAGSTSRIGVDIQTDKIKLTSPLLIRLHLLVKADGEMRVIPVDFRNIFL